MISVPTTEEIAALESRVRKLELTASTAAPTGIVPIASLPCGARKARRLHEAGKLPVFRVGGGRRLYCRIADFIALAEPAARQPKPSCVVSAEPCADSADYAARNLRLLVGGGR
jgi:hypothetical protein